MPNPFGINQKGSQIERSEELSQLLQSYADRGIKSWDEKRAALAKDCPDIGLISRSSLGNLMKEFGTVTARKRNMEMDEEDIYHSVITELNKDPIQARGPVSIQQRLQHQGIHIPVNDIKTIMQAISPEGFFVRNPFYQSTGKVKHGGKVLTLGPHDKWAGDGHEKMEDIGFPIYGLRDYWGKILGYWIVPNDRDRNIVDYLYLITVARFDGIPICVTTDKGTETTAIYARHKSFREHFAPGILDEEVPSFIFLKSVYNIVIERSWKEFWHTEGKNLRTFWSADVLRVGFNGNNVIHRAVADWVWVPLFQAAIDTYVQHYNDHRVRHQVEKPGPSNCSPNFAFDHPEQFGGTSHLIPIPNDEMRAAVQDIIQNHPGRPDQWFYPMWFGNLVTQVYNQSGLAAITYENAWDIWKALLPLVSAGVETAEENGQAM